MTVKIPQYLEPEKPTLIQPDMPHQSAIEISMAQATTALWYHNRGNAHVYCWPDPLAAPHATIATHATYTDFVVGSTHSTEPKIPWLAMEGADKLFIRAEFFLSEALPVKVRYQTETLIDAVATQTSAERYILESYFQEQRNSSQSDLYDFVNTGMGVIGICSTTMEPSYPASREIAIVCQVKLDTFLEHITLNGADTVDRVKVIMRSLYVADRFPIASF